MDRLEDDYDDATRILCQGLEQVFDIVTFTRFEIDKTHLAYQESKYII